MKGSIRLPLNDRQFFVVAGGPYMAKPEGYVGVKMAKEINLPCAVSIPTADFSVPDPKLMAKGLDEAVNRILLGQPLYVGCMGGIGRTGLFLAILAKAFDVKNPVRFVRENYLSHAVETPQQMKYVTDFTVPAKTARKIAIARFFLRFFRKNLLTKAA